jgi:spore germination protein YaaH
VEGLRTARTLAVSAVVLALAVAAPPAWAGRTRSDAPWAVPEGGKASQNPPPAPLQAFLLASSPDSFADLQAHAGAVGVVYPTYFECALPGGAVVGTPNPEVDAYAAAHQLVEEPRFSCQDGAVVHRLLTQPALRARTLAQLVALAAGPSYAGLNLDLENDGAWDRGAFTSFVRALAARLHALGRRLSVDVVGVSREDPRSATYIYDDRALAAAADTVFVEAWGVHWEGSAPGPLAPLPFVRAVARRLASLPHAHRFVLGVPMYGLDWPVVGGRPRRATALQYGGVLALARSVGATPVRDPGSGELTFAYGCPSEATPTGLYRCPGEAMLTGLSRHPNGSTPTRLYRRANESIPTRLYRHPNEASPTHLHDAYAGVTHRVWYLDARAVLDRLLIAHRYGLAAGVWRLGEEDQALWSSLAPGLT